MNMQKTSAKQSQSALVPSKIRGPVTRRRKKSGGDAQPTKRPFPASIRTCRRRGGKRAKRSQFGPDRPQQAPATRAASAAAADNRAKRSQFARSDGKGQVPFGKRVITNWACKGLGQNKANFHPSDRRAGSGIRRWAPAAPRSAATSLRLDAVKPRRYFKWLVWSLWDTRASGDSAGNEPARWWGARKSNLIIPVRDAVPNQGRPNT